MKYLITILIFLSIGTGCEKIIEFDIPIGQEKLVINCFLNPHEERIVVFITSSQHILTEPKHLPGYLDSKPIEHASVDIFENNRLIDSFKFKQHISGKYNNAYESRIVEIKTEIEYRIEVLAEGFDQVYATTIIPENNAKVVAVYGTPSADEFGESLTEIRINVRENDLKKNFYGIQVNTQNVLRTKDPQIIDTRNPSLVMFEDKVFHNGYGEIYFGINEIDLHRTYTSDLISASEDYFMYQKTLNTQIENQEAKIFPGNPGEVYSNIENGYGIFAGYNPQPFAYRLDGSVYDFPERQDFKWRTDSEAGYAAVATDIFFEQIRDSVIIEADSSKQTYYGTRSSYEFTGSDGSSILLLIQDWNVEERYCIQPGHIYTLDGSLGYNAEFNCVPGLDSSYCNRFELHYRYPHSNSYLKAIDHAYSELYFDYCNTVNSTFGGSIIAKLEDNTKLHCLFKALKNH